MATLHPIAEHDDWQFSAPDLALWHASSGTAVIADPHLFDAKARTSRGIALTDTVNEAKGRFRAMMEHLRPERLVILGDLVDGRLTNIEQMQLAELIAEVEWQWITVPGRHDNRLRSIVDRLPGIIIRDEVIVEGWHMVHGDEPTQLPAIIGHAHPVIDLPDDGNTGTTVPALLVWNDLMILPAFNRFSVGVNARIIAHGHGLSSLPQAAHHDSLPSVYAAIDGRCYRFSSLADLQE